VMRLLSEARADLGEQVNVARTPEGVLRIQGVVDTDQRKRELLNALAPVITHRAIVVEIKSASEVLAEQARSKSKVGSPPLTVERVEAEAEQFPAYEELRSRFSDEDSRRFADRMVELSRRAMSHAGAMKRLANKFSAKDLSTLTPESRSKWLTLIRTHARAFEQTTKAIRQELQPIFFRGGAAGESGADLDLSTDDQLASAINRLFSIGLANERMIIAAFTVSNAKGAVAEIHSAQFARSLREVESLASSIARVSNAGQNRER